MEEAKSITAQGRPASSLKGGPFKGGSYISDAKPKKPAFKAEPTTTHGGPGRVMMPTEIEPTSTHGGPGVAVGS